MFQAPQNVRVLKHNLQVLTFSVVLSYFISTFLEIRGFNSGNAKNCKYYLDQ